MAALCNVFQQGFWCSGIAVEHFELAISIWFLDEYYDSCEERGHRSLNFNSENWRSSCFSRNKVISF